MAIMFDQRIKRYTHLVILLLWACAGNGIPAQALEFKQVRVGTYRSESCGVGDFNNDGKLDIIAGPYWYEAPDWTPHPFRELGGKVDEEGKGYDDDFMNAPMDIDGDGKALEILPHTQTTYWYERDGKGGFTRHDVSAENSIWGGGCGDFNGDGRPDILRPIFQLAAAANEAMCP